MTRLNLRGFAAVVAVSIIVLMAGCGGGGGSAKGNLTGAVTDVDGQAVAGARVSVGSNTTTSLSNGTFQLQNVGDGIQVVHADIDINGHHWSGQTATDLGGGLQNRSVNVVVSDERFQGGIGGSVIDPSGFGLPGAKVFISGPLGSTLAVTDKNGNYEADRLTPNVTYTVVCSLAGYLNDSKTVHVAQNTVSAASFALAVGGSSGPLPAPANLRTQSWTVADTISRASGTGSSVYDWLKRLYRHKKGLPDAVAATHIQRKGATRSTPAGSVIEVDLFWDYQSFGDLFGYAVKRGVSQNALDVTAVLRDPAASAFFDVDPILTPDTVYYYTVHRLDTVNFPAQGDPAIGPASNVASANPLGPIRALSPNQGDLVSSAPTLQWSPVNGAESYQIYVWDRFPDLQNSSDPNGVIPIWPADVNNPGASLVGGGATSQTYQGPALQSGHTYYWLVVASDSQTNSLSSTPIGKFTVR